MMIILSLALSAAIAGVPEIPVAGETLQAATHSKPAQARAKAVSSDRTAAMAQAYYLFIRARQLESEGNTDLALDLLQQAAKLDPSSGDIPAAIASVRVRQGRLREAIAAAESALKIDPDTVAAHQLLGNIYAAYAEGEQVGRTRVNAAGRDDLDKAITHFEAVLTARGATAEPSLLLTLGRLYVRTSAFDKAIAVLLRFNLQEPGTMDGAGLLAQAYTGAGRTDDAIAVLSRAAEKEPEFYPPLADLYQRTGRWREAADAYKRGVDAGNTGAEINRRWALALLNTARPGDAAKARDLLDQIVKASPNDARTVYLLFEAQRQLKDDAAAEATARRLMALESGGASGAYALAQVFEDRHEPRKVVETLQPVADRVTDADAEAKGIDLAPILMHLGFAYIDLDEPDRAIAALQRAKRAAPENPTVDVGLVQAEIAARRYARAADIAQQAGTRHPDDVRLTRLEAEALRQNGQIDRGVSLLEGVRRAHPENPTNYVALAELLMGSARNEQATEVLQQARGRFPNDVNVLFSLGAVYERQKRYADAEQAFKAALAQDPLNAQALNYLGYMLADRGTRLQESVGYIERALKIEPNNPAYLDSLGWAYFKMNRLDLAERNLRAAAIDRPKDSAVQDHWGDLLSKLGRRDEAIAAWKRALSGDGEDVNRAAIEAKIRAAGGK